MYYAIHFSIFLRFLELKFSQRCLILIPNAKNLDFRSIAESERIKTIPRQSVYVTNCLRNSDKVIYAVMQMGIWEALRTIKLTWSSESFCNNCFRNFLFANFASFKRSSSSLTVESLRIFNIGLRVALVRLFITPCGFLRNSITWKSQETYLALSLSPQK